VKIRTVIGLAGATAASLVGMAGLAAVPAGAGGNGAVNMPASQLTNYLQTNYPYPFPGVVVFTPLIDPSTLPPGTLPPNFKVSGDCETVAPWLFTDSFNSPPYLALNFTSGNAVVYQTSSSPLFPLPGGLNAVGTADLIDLNTGDTFFSGPTHVWLGQGANVNGEFYAGETVSFSGTYNGHTINITVNPGEIQSAGQNGGHFGGWGQQNVSCS
jgi:hypothetical protein